MKVYDIIVEGEAGLGKTAYKVGRRLLGMSRSFETAAGKRIFDTAVQELADEIYRIESSLGRAATELDQNKSLAKTLYTRDSANVFTNPRSADYLTPEAIRELKQDVIDAAKKLADKRLKDAGVANPTIGGKIKDKVLSAAGKTIAKHWTDVIMASGLYYSTVGSDNGPIHNYLVRMEMADHKLKIGPDGEDTEYPEYSNGRGWSQAQYDTYKDEEVAVMVANLAPYMIPFGRWFTNLGIASIAGNVFPTAAMGGALALLRPKGWDWKNKALFAVWVAALDNQEKIATGLGVDFNLQNFITLAVLDEGKIATGGRWTINAARRGIQYLVDKANNAVIEFAKKNGIPFMGGPPALAPVPQQVTPNKPAADPANTNKPAADPASSADTPTVFHPNEWVKRGGSWQHKTSRHTLTNYEYSQLKDGDPILLD